MGQVMDGRITHGMEALRKVYGPLPAYWEQVVGVVLEADDELQGPCPGFDDYDLSILYGLCRPKHDSLARKIEAELNRRSEISEQHIG